MTTEQRIKYRSLQGKIIRGEVLIEKDQKDFDYLSELRIKLANNIRKAKLIQELAEFGNKECRKAVEFLIENDSDEAKILRFKKNW